MKFEIKKTILVKAVSDVMKAISNNAAKTILTGVKIEASEKEITLYGTDANVSIERIIPLTIKEKEVASVQKVGSIVLNAKIFSEIIRKLPKDQITIEVGDKLITKIISGKSSTKLNGLDSEEYPLFPELKSETHFKMGVSEMKSIEAQTAFSVATSETRPVLRGLHFMQGKLGLTVVATDSHRLSRKVLNLPGDEKSVVIPASTFVELCKVLNDPEDIVDITISDNQILFAIPGMKFYSRLLDGSYPDTSRLIPKDFTTEIKVDAKELIGALDRCNLLAKEGKNHIVKLETKETYFTLTSNNQEVGVIEEEVLSEIKGEALSISFSSKFAMDALRTLSSKEVLVKFSGAMRPFIMKDTMDQSITQLILPVKTY